MAVPFCVTQQNGGGGGSAGASGLATADAGTAIADNKVVRGDGTTGIQGSLVDISDAGAVTGATLLDVDNLRLDGNVLGSINANGNINLTPNGAGQATIPAGSATNPGLAFTADLGRGLFASGGGTFFTISATSVAGVSANGNFEIGATRQYTASSNSSPALGSEDVGMKRDAAGVWRDTDGGGGLGSRLMGRSVEASTAGSGAPNLLLAIESRKLITNEGATVEAYNLLPSAVSTLEFIFCCQDADGIRVVAGAGDTIRLGGAASAAAGFVRSAVVGSVIILTCINVTEWVAISVVGTWTVDI